MHSTRAKALSVSWRWLRGVSTVDQNSVGGLAGQFSTAYRPGSRKDTAIAVTTSKDLYLFGGYSSSGSLGDLWTYQGHQGWSEIGEWSWIGGLISTYGYQAVLVAPTPMPGARLASLASADSSGNVYVFSGEGKGASSLEGVLNDLWKFDTTEFLWEKINGHSLANTYATYGTKGIASSSNTPGGIQSSGLLHTDAYGNILLFGGYGRDASAVGRLNDVWYYNVSSNIWTWKNGASARNSFSVNGNPSEFDPSYVPGGRSYTATMDRYRQGICYIFGGYGYTTSSIGKLADLWAYNVVTDQWAFIAGESVSFNADVLGSYGSLGEFYSWATHHPGSRQKASGFVDDQSNMIGFFGGDGYDTASSGRLGDFWVYNASGWAWISGFSEKNTPGTLVNSEWFSPSNMPGSQESSSIIQTEDITYLFGGYGSSIQTGIGYLGALWATRGPTVPTQPMSPTPSPSPVPTPTPVVVLPELQWRWVTGSTINNAAGVSGMVGEFSASFRPMNRKEVTFAMDTKNSRLYVYGGRNNGNDLLGDLWAYRHFYGWSSVGEWGWIGGLTSTENYEGTVLEPTPRPGCRRDNLIWYDTSEDRLFIFGGFGKDTSNNLGELSDAWSFNAEERELKWSFRDGRAAKGAYGTYGTQGIPISSNWPGCTYQAQIVHETGNTLLMYGGYGKGASGSTGVLGTMWHYNMTSRVWTWMNGQSIANVLGVGGPAGVFDSTYYPGCRRYFASMNHVSRSNLLYVFGGNGYTINALSGNLQDLWAYNIETNQWAYIHGESRFANKEYPFMLTNYGVQRTYLPSNQPGSGYAVGWSDPDSDLLCVQRTYGYTSSQSQGKMNEFWVFNTTKNMWSWVGGVSGINEHGTLSDATWYSTSNQPGCRQDMYTLTVHNMMLIYGGNGYAVNSGSGTLGDLWSAKLGTAPAASPTPSPSPVPTPTPVVVLPELQWRWVTGSTINNAAGVSGMVGEFSVSFRPMNRKDVTFAMDTKNSRLYVYGGRDNGNDLLGDLWAYRHFYGWSSVGEWGWVGGLTSTENYGGSVIEPTPRPGCRRDNLIWYDTSEDRLFIFGGYGKDTSTNEGSLSDIWSFNAEERELKWSFRDGRSIRNAYGTYGTQGISLSSNWPGCTYQAQIVHETGNTLLMYGGYGKGASGSTGALGTMWHYNMTSRVWTWMNGQSIANALGVGGPAGVFDSTYYPGCRRYFASMNHVSRSNLLYVFGGNGYTINALSGYLQDLWAYNIETNQWAYIHGESRYANIEYYFMLTNYGVQRTYLPSNQPGSGYAVGWSDPDSDLLCVQRTYGYTSSQSQGKMNEFWVFNTTKNMWSWVGGVSNTNEHGTLSDATWYSTSNQPGCRQDMYTLTVHNMMLMFGGSGYAVNSGTGTLGDLWSAKLGTAPAVSPTPSPSPIPSAAPTYVLAALEWRWLGGSTLSNPPTICGVVGEFSSAYMPSGRRKSVLTSADSRNRIYLFSGQHGSGYLGDLWAYGGLGSWSTVGEWGWLGGMSATYNYRGYYGGATPYPGSGYGSSLWFDDSTNRVFVHGGQRYDAANLLGTMGDTWSFDATEGQLSWSYWHGPSLRNQYGNMGTKSIESETSYPGSGYYTETLHSGNDHAYIYGGYGKAGTTSTGSKAELWRFNKTSCLWTWLNGPSVVNIYSSGGQAGVFGSTYFPGGRYLFASMDHVSRSGVVYIYGGQGYSTTKTGLLMDLWAYNVETNRWAYMHGESRFTNDDFYFMSPSYGFRGESYATTHPGTGENIGWSDPNNVDFLCIMRKYGSSSDGIGTLNDFWVFNITSKMWSWAGGDSGKNIYGTLGDAEWFSSSNIPGGHQWANAVTAKDLMIQFGGQGYGLGNTGKMNVLWATRGAIVVGVSPTVTPTPSPTWDPAVPTPTCALTPTVSPTTSPTASPTISPTVSSTATSTAIPTPTVSSSTSASPTLSPTSSPSASPTVSPSASPTVGPAATTTSSPTSSPSASPTVSPSASPTVGPAATTTSSPTNSPSASPTVSPSTSPTVGPAATATYSPTSSPSASPTVSPSTSPTTSATVSPTTSPTTNPTSSPSSSPSTLPTTSTTAIPTSSPSTGITASPSSPPTTSPTVVPASTPTPNAGGPGSGSGGASSGGMDETALLIIAIGATIVGVIVIVIAALASTKRGRGALKQLISGKTTQKVVVRTRNSIPLESIDSAQKLATQQQPIVYNVTNITIAGDAANVAQIQPGDYVYAHHAQTPVDPSHIYASQGDIMRVEQTDPNGWLYVSTVDSMGQVEQSGWYPQAWCGKLDSQPVFEIHSDEDDDIPLK